MPTDQIQTIEQTAYEGILSPGQSTTLGVAAAMLVVWLLWRQRHSLGAWAPLLFAMRLAAIGLALWMLAGPTHLVIERVTSPQSIALLIDDTRSMGVTDPPEPTEDLRWRLAAAESPSKTWEELVLLCDRSGVHAAEALIAAGRLADAIREHRPSGSLRPLADQATRTIETAHALLTQAAAAAGAEDDLLAVRIDRITTLFDQAATPALETITDRLGAAAPGAGALDEKAAAAEALTLALAEAERRLRSVSRDAVRRAAEAIPALDGGATRKERVSAVLEKLEADVLGRLEKTCVVHRLRFSEVAHARNAEHQKPSLTKVSLNGDTASYAQAGQGGPPPKSSNNPTDVAAVLQQVERLRSTEPLRVAVMLTDGRHNAPAEVTPRDMASRIGGAPVHVTPIGSSTPVRDLLIQRVQAPTRVAQKDTATIEVLFTALDCTGEDVEVILTRDGDEVDRKRMLITRDWQDSRVQFRIDTASGGGDDALGRREYEIEVSAVDDEASLTNNLGVATIDVVRDKLRVLLADRGPRWEYRFLQQLFRRDKHVDFDELLVLPKTRATGRLAATGRLPTDADGWAEYDVVILGDLGPQTLGVEQQASLDEYVRQRGGAVVLIAGRTNMPQTHRGGPLIELLPVTLTSSVTPQDGFGVALTDEARLASCVALRESFADSQRVWRTVYSRLPIYGLSDYCLAKPNTNVLIEAAPISLSAGSVADQRLAFFSWHPLGAGKVAYLAAPQSYQLKFRRGDKDHHAFWGQTLRWITADQGPGRAPVRIDTDRIQYAAGQPIEVTVWLRDSEGRPVEDADVAVEARSLDSVAAEAELRPEKGVPGRYVGLFDRLPTGAFELVPTGGVLAKLLAQAEPPRKLINIESTADIEMLDTQSNRPLLEQIAEQTGGRVTPPTALAELLETASLDPTVTDSPPRRTPLWNRWSYLLVIAGCLATEWIVRKAKGLT